MLDADPHSLIVPFASWRPWRARSAISAGVASAGGFLTGWTDAAIADALRPWSVVLQSGATIKSGLRFGQTITSPFADISLSWIPRARPRARRLWRLRPVSRSSVIGSSISAGGSSTVGRRKRDRRVFAAQRRSRNRRDDVAGSGVEGEPCGVVNAIGVTALAGASLTYGTCVSAKASATAGGAPSGSWIAAPATRALLEERERFANGEWRSGRTIGSRAGLHRDTKRAGGDAARRLLAERFHPHVRRWSRDRPKRVRCDFVRGGVLQLRIIVQMDVLLPLPASLVVLSAVS